MKKIGVHKKLNDIGMSVFIEFFNEFKDKVRIIV